MTTTDVISPVERRTLKIVFVTPDEPSVMPAFFAKVVPAVADDIAAIAVVSPIFKRSSWLSQAKRFADAFGAREFAVEALQFAGHKGADVARRIVPRGAHHSVKSVARAHGQAVLTPEDVNAPAFLSRLRELDPDLVISVSCPQIFREELLAIPRLGCINVHSALLPHYRGMLPTFWVLANGEEETGVTVHYMTPGIDGGGILLQRAIPITPTETLHSLMGKTKAVAADLIIEAIAGFRAGPMEASPNPPDEGSYFSFPTREDVRRLKARGRRMR
jgi:methionyl-tRNA formyltransferase